MKSRTTFIWFLIAVVLAGFIWFSQKYLQHAPAPQSTLLSGLRTADVTFIQISPAGTHEINVVRTNQGWLITAPISYPAQSAAIESLLSALEKLMPSVVISAGEMAGHKNADSEFGFEDPQFNVDISAGDQSWHLKVGNKTALGDGVYVRLVGENGAFITDPAWVQLLPREAGNWRNTALVDVSSDVDWIVITNGAKAIEFRCNPTNHLWRMVRPLQARADPSRVAVALQQLRSATVSKFVNDDPKADLTTYGLQPPALDVWLGQGTNYLAALHVGKELPDDPASVYAQRHGWNSVMATAAEPLAPWRSAVNDWRDRRLIDLSASVAEIDVTGDNGYVLQQQHGATNWVVAGEKYPADLETIQHFVRLLVNLRVSDFVKDVVTGTDLQDFGLVTNTHQIILRGAVGDTNAPLCQLIFGGTNTADHIFVKRGDEDFVYALSLDDYRQLPENGWEFRDRRIWSFSETNVENITLHQTGRTMEMIRLGPNSWTLAAGSQGLIKDTLGIDEAVHRLGDLVCDGWVDRNFAKPEDLGFTTNSLQIDIQLKSGQKFTVDFGGVIPQKQTVVAAATLDGERWAFVFPAATLPLVAQFLTIPAPPQ